MTVLLGYFTFGVGSVDAAFMGCLCAEEARRGRNREKKGEDDQGCLHFGGRNGRYVGNGMI